MFGDVYDTPVFLHMTLMSARPESNMLEEINVRSADVVKALDETEGCGGAAEQRCSVAGINPSHGGV